MSVDSPLYVSTLPSVCQYTPLCMSVHSPLYVSTLPSVCQYTTLCMSVHSPLYVSTLPSVCQYTPNKQDTPFAEGGGRNQFRMNRKINVLWNKNQLNTDIHIYTCFDQSNTQTACRCIDNTVSQYYLNQKLHYWHYVYRKTIYCCPF
jgi:hypothetical protein